MQSDKQEAKWRDQFKKLGREAVRDKLHAGVYWRTRQGAVAPNSWRHSGHGLPKQTRVEKVRSLGRQRSTVEHNFRPGAAP